MDHMECTTLLVQLNLKLWYYGQVYVIIVTHIRVKGTATVSNARGSATPNTRNKNLILKHCAQFTNCINEIDNAQDIDVVMPVYNLIEYSDNSKTSVSLWQYYIDEPFINDNRVIINVPHYPHNASFKYRQITGQTGNDRTKDVQIMVPLKCLSNFWRTLEMPLINCKINSF